MKAAARPARRAGRPPGPGGGAAGRTGPRPARKRAGPPAGLPDAGTGTARGGRPPRVPQARSHPPHPPGTGGGCERARKSGAAAAICLLCVCRGGRAPPHAHGGGGRRAEGTTPDSSGPGWPVGANKPPAGRMTRAGRLGPSLCSRWSRRPARGGRPQLGDGGPSLRAVGEPRGAAPSANAVRPRQRPLWIPLDPRQRRPPGTPTYAARFARPADRGRPARLGPIECNSRCNHV